VPPPPPGAPPGGGPPPPPPREDRNGSKRSGGSQSARRDFTSRKASGISTADDDDDEILDPEAEEDEAAILERARQRRLAIMAKHSNASTPSGDTIGQSSNTDVPDPVAEVVELPKDVARVAASTRDSTDSPALATPAELSPIDLPSHAELVASAAAVAKAEVSKVEAPAAPAAAATGEVEDALDIFGSFDVEAAAQKNTSKAEKKDTKDVWADSEGYYKISAGELLERRYRVRGYTGSGVFSNVVKAMDTQENDLVVAIKIIRNNELMFNAGKKELEIIRVIQAADKDGKHHCVKFLRHFIHKGHLCMVFEACSMNLREVTKKYGRDDGEVVGLSMEAVRKYAQQMLLALKLMRKCNVVHADIKPDNILVNDSKTQVKLCDFGSASRLDNCEITEYLQSRFYRAPEIALGVENGFGIDMWSLATTLYELYTGRILFNDNKNNNQLLKQHMDLKGKPSVKFIRKGAYKDKHFDMDNAFLHHELDPVTQKDRLRRLTTINPSVDLMQRLKKNQKLNEDEKRKLVQFKDLLDKMLVIDPSKRITPKEALQHDFIKLPV